MIGRQDCDRWLETGHVQDPLPGGRFARRGAANAAVLGVCLVFGVKRQSAATALSFHPPTGPSAPGLRSSSFVTLLSPPVTAFHKRNGSRRSVMESGAEWRRSALAARTMLEALTRAMASRDGATAEHSRRVQRYATALALEVCAEDDVLIEAVQTGALLHDIGKLALPDRLLHKPGPLTREEYEQVKYHAVIGAEMLEAVDCAEPLPSIVRHHHENWDGSGYPDGLAGSEIPFGARVLSIVDCYDALTSERPYRPRLSHERALEIIASQRGTMYDPAITDAFLRIVHRLRAMVPASPVNLTTWTPSVRTPGLV